MNNAPPLYLRLTEGDLPPDLGDREPFRAVLIADCKVSTAWRNLLSDWLVVSGCLYMIAWGIDCSLWDDTVDLCNLERFNFGDTPENEEVMTTWHDNETLREVLRFAKFDAHHPSVALKRTLVIHVGTKDRQSDFTEQYLEAMPG